MLTDDDLTNELGAAFRATTGDLTYAGRRRPRRTAVVAVPAAAVGLSIAAIAVASLNSGTTPAPSHPATAASSPAASPSKKLVDETITLAGFTVRYQREEGQPAPLVAKLVEGGLPDGVTPVPLTGTEAKAWVGKDASGANAIFVQAPTRADGHLFELFSTVYTQDELVDFLKNGTPKTVPLVKE